VVIANFYGTRSRSLRRSDLSYQKGKIRAVHHRQTVSDSCGAKEASKGVQGALRK